jgi:hypothetical protein
MASLDLVDITISVPNGTVTHDDGHVLCVYGSSLRSSFYIVAFFAANYAAHAATVKSNPGDKLPVTVCNIILALLFPVSGLMRAVNAIVRFGRRGRSDVQKACRAGALCMVVRVPGWIPAEGQTLDATLVHQTWTKCRRDQDEEGVQMNDIRVTTSHQGSLADVRVYRPDFAAEGSSKWLYSDAVGGRANVSSDATKIHGSYTLPQGYGFAILPRNTRLLEWTNSSTDTSATLTNENHLASTYSLAKAAISIIQALAAFATLLGHREDIVRKWGYASFHLTIIPYLVMTLFNFVSNICTADYDCLYMVETLVMDEARGRGGLFEGTVAATYTVAGDRVPTSPTELKSYNGLNKDTIRALDWRIEDIEEMMSRNANLVVALPILVMLPSTPWTLRSSAARERQRKRLSDLKGAWLGSWTKKPGKILEVNCSRAASAMPEVSGPIEPHLRPHGSEIEQLDDGSTRSLGIGVGHEIALLVEIWKLGFGPMSLRSSRYRFEDAPHPFHTCDQGITPSPGSPQCTARTTYVLTDGGRLSISYPPTRETGRSPRYYTKDLETAARHLAKFEDLKEKLQVNRGADKAAVATAYADVVISFRIFKLWMAMVGSGNSSLVSKVPCAACDQQQAEVLTKAVLYFPTCHRFLRGDDTSPEIDQQLRALSLTTDHGSSRCRTVDSRMPVRKSRHPFGGMLAQLIVGVLVNGIILTLIGSQSKWFAAG